MKRGTRGRGNKKTKTVHMRHKLDTVTVDGVECVEQNYLMNLCWQSVSAAGWTGKEAEVRTIKLAFEIQLQLFDAGLPIYDKEKDTFTMWDDDPDWPEDCPRKIVERPRGGEWLAEIDTERGAAK